MTTSCWLCPLLLAVVPLPTALLYAFDTVKRGRQLSGKWDKQRTFVLFTMDSSITSDVDHDPRAIVRSQNHTANRMIELYVLEEPDIKLMLNNRPSYMINC